jgi:hypothetical protein
VKSILISVLVLIGGSSFAAPPSIKTIDILQFPAIVSSAPIAAGASKAKLLYNSTLNRIMASISGAAYVSIFPASVSAPVGVLPNANGGTGTQTYTTGDLLSATSTDTLTKLAVGTAGSVLTVSGGVASWQPGNVSTFAKYYTTAGPTIASGAFRTVDYSTKVQDDCSPACVTTGASWVYTVRVAGTYEVCAQIWYLSAAWVAGQQSWLRVWKNSATSVSEGPIYTAFNATYYIPNVINCDKITGLVVNDTLTIQAFNNRVSASPSLTTTAVQNWVVIRRVER